MNTKFSLVLQANGQPVAEFDAREFVVVATDIIRRYDESVAAPVAEVATPAPIRQPGEQDVLDFLNSHPVYTQRTFEAVCSYFDRTPDTDLIVLLRNLVDAGRVRTLRRRGDGVTLYEANTVWATSVVTEPVSVAPTPVSVAPTPVSVAPTAYVASAPAPGLDVYSLQDFLRNDDRYQWRTIAAVTSHFNVGVNEARTVISEAVNRGMVDAGNRSRDSVAIYRAC